MKDTDYAPRAAFFDTLLNGQDLILCEIGVSAGAHAHALLKYCSVRKLYLVDPWDEANRFTEGYCTGRLYSGGFKNNIEMIAKESMKAVALFADDSLHGIYFDQKHEYDAVRNDLHSWWPKLKSGGLLGHRNYAESIPQIKKAIDEFVEKKKLRTLMKEAEIVIFK